MDVRQRTEEIEHMTFAPWATFSDQSRGRMLPEEQDPIRPVFQRDRDRVLHCKAFRRLKQKTQVFLSPEGDLYRTRLTHTLEVSQIARTIARALRLNEDLTEAISLAHDLGHTPFGHAGERALNELCPDGFKHYMQSLRVVDKLEKDGRGLNLTWEVRNGIVTHTKGTWAATPEGRIVRMADQIAYVNHDIEDAVRAGVLDPATLPKECTAVLGQTKSARITTMINSILANSDGDVKVGAEENEAFLALRDFMYATVYVDKTAKREEQKVDKVIGELYDYYLNHVDRMSNFYIQLAYQEGRERAVTDYISGMSDEFAIRTLRNCLCPGSGMSYKSERSFERSMIPHEYIEELTRRTDIVELVGSYVQLKRKGRLYGGLCPFHSEKRPHSTSTRTPRAFTALAAAQAAMPLPLRKRSTASITRRPLSCWQRGPVCRSRRRTTKQAGCAAASSP